MIQTKAPYNDYSRVALQKPGSSSPQGYSSEPDAIPYWGENPEIWDTVIFNGEPLPGICVLGGKAFEVKKDHKKPPGTHGASTSYMGRQPAEPEFKLTLWTAEHLYSFQKIMAAFLPKTGKGLSRAVSVIHPQLTLYKIKRVRLESASFLMEREPQVFEVVLKCYEADLRDGKTNTRTGETIAQQGPGVLQGELTMDQRLANQQAISEGRPLPYLPKSPAPDATNGNGPLSSIPPNLVKDDGGFSHKFAMPNQQLKAYTGGF